ncbi:MAG: UDP-2,3-diacylglucosamine diphosphatase LpxI [Verrucomicrobia bacterium]|nr:UDP-2,3-diacylglucosamine diphosphatase LpxI [Verrucomicrobiota bacterium]
MVTQGALGLIAGNGIYPLLVAKAARRSGVPAIHVAAFENETDPAIASLADSTEWLRVGQLGRLLGFLSASGVRRAMMAGQLAPKNLFNLRPDLKALMLLARLRERNAESLFGAVAAELAVAGIELLPAYTFLEDSLAPEGAIAGPRPKRRWLDDARFGFGIAKEIARLDIGQTAVVRNGTVLAVEAFEGTNEAMQRGATLGRGQAVVVKVSKPNQDLRFDVPVIGVKTFEVAAQAGVRLIAVEARLTLLLDRPAVCNAANRAGIALHGLKA